MEMPMPFTGTDAQWPMHAELLRVRPEITRAGHGMVPVAPA